jgi:hypothetical protein
MGTLCKNCPFKGIKTETDSCTTIFAKKYHNSCVTYDITEHKEKQEKKKFIKELEEFTKEKKTSIDSETKEAIAEIVSSVANAAAVCENNNNQTE